MSVTLYHIPGFRSTRAVWMFCEIALAYGNDCLVIRDTKLNIHTFDPQTFRTDKPDWYLKINANGKVPAMVDDTVEGEAIKMFDGTAISCYLLHRFDTERKLLDFNDPSAVARFYQSAFYASGTIDNLPATSSPIQRVLDDPMAGKKNWEQNKVAWDSLCGPLVVALLGDKPFFNGDTFGAIDVVIGFDVFIMDKKVGWLKPFPSLMAYAERISSRPALLKALEGHASYASSK